MFKNMRLGVKMALSFGVLLALLVMVSFAAWNAINGSSNGFKTYRTLARETNMVGRLQANMLMVRMNVKDFIINGSDKDREQYNEYLAKMNGFLEKAKKEIDAPERASKINEVATAIREYEAGFDKVVAFRDERNHRVKDILDVKGPFMEKSLTDILVSAEKDNDMTAAFHSSMAMRNLLLARLYAMKFLDTNDPKAAERVKQEFGQMQQSLATLDKELQNPERRKLLEGVVEARNVYESTFNEVVAIIFDRNKIIHETLDRLGPMVAENTENVELSIKEQQDELGPRLQANNQQAVTVIVGVALVSLILGAFLAFFLTRSITRPINRAIEGLGDNADQVVSASTQVSSASQSLAEGASEQAASIEETSSSLEEMSSMTKQNAENANQADAITKEAGKLVMKANEAMGRLTASMEEISAASAETSKIIKTIDEIAFQTNLLALNAAVEAARAGEAGAGFAVVADEVRNLAMRAAEAAKNTANLIEGTVTKVNEGSGLVKVTSETFGEAASMTNKTGDLVSEIAAASSEQAQGIDQINKAITEMDKVTQLNAASAEESASASEEMNAQAEQMKSIVAGLEALVGGNRNGGTRNNKPGHAPRTKTVAKAIPAAHQKTKKPGLHGTREINPEQMIPLDEDSFKDF